MRRYQPWLWVVSTKIGKAPQASFTQPNRVEIKERKGYLREPSRIKALEEKV
jgi:hypothetical protein